MSSKEKLVKTIEFPDPYRSVYEKVIMEFESRIRRREMEGIEHALRQYGYVKRRGFSRTYAHDYQKCMCCGFEPDFWPTHCEETAWDFCPKCGAAVIDHE